MVSFSRSCRNQARPAPPRKLRTPPGRLVAAFVAVAGLLAACYGREESPPEPRDASPGSPSALRVLTLNLAHGRGNSAEPLGWPREAVEERLDAAAHVLRRERPHVVALQEVDGPSTLTGGFDHLERLKSAAEFAHSFRGFHFDQGFLDVRFRYGTAVLADRDLAGAVSSRFANNDLNSKGFVAARIELDERPLLIVSVHLNSASQEMRRKQAGELIEFIRGVTVPVMICGDMNSQWRYANDAVRLLARELDLVAFEPESSALNTFPSATPQRRIDWILISPELKFTSYRVLDDELSDHRAVAAEVSWKERASRGAPEAE
jgi:endonuclease/exonuclease/phosphatase family metal-dependent hydrolase